MSKLVIVESPAKARTISQFLGKEYEVLASFGHVRDLPNSADDIPAEYKKQKWAKLGVNVENDFEPLYIVPDDKRRHVDSLKKASKGATELLLATDEDREGESISWHILQLLKPKKGIPVRRIVFHEITPEAIREALRSPRSVDENLVRAQETRRILDRLYGYSLSPLLWKKVAPKLSAGRVQSVAVRLTVERERERMRFMAATYWDLEATLGATDGQFDARLTHLDGKRVASGRNFDPESGKLVDNVMLVSEELAGKLADQAKASKEWVVTAVETTPGQEKPPMPFMTSTLQQEGNRKLRFPSKRTMQIAQQLYEGIAVGGQTVGLITYMRTDSLNLADRALTEAREVIKNLYGDEYLPAKPVKYKTKSKGAQEAHEAIRPTDLSRRPQDIKKYLNSEQFALYELIWKRTIACQMQPAKVNRTSVTVRTEVPSGALDFAASGKTIVFPGFLRAYVEGTDDPEAEIEGQERTLPAVKQGQHVNLIELDTQSHTTRPPARYTEASLVKKLEEEGVGRPSTYASIISTVQDRGYVVKKGNELIPTFTAFAVTTLLEDHFDELVDTRFTATMEENLDEIADGKRSWVAELKEFYLGTPEHPGLDAQITAKQADIPFPNVELGTDPSGQPVVVRVGRYGTFVQRGEGGAGNTANVPLDIAPADLSLEQALAMIDNKAAGPAPIGTDPESGQSVYKRSGRFGDYLEVALTEEEEKAGVKPRRVTLPKELVSAELDNEELTLLLRFPRVVGRDPDTGSEVTALIGQYGPYVKSGTESRNIPDWREAAEIDLETALQLLAAPKITRGGKTMAAPRAALKEFSSVDGYATPIRVMEGRYGPYVTDGTVNATLPRGTSPETLTPEMAAELLKAKAAAGPAKKKSFARRGTTKTKRKA
ncbi:MAG: type I DNA topoisomerase [Chthonomonas sp.]|nr:type I DNA topoisomerase [Chthonomonas sp.]